MSFDVSTKGPRQVVDAARARELVDCSPDVTRVKLSNKSYTLEAALVMAEKLATLDKVRCVDISDVIAGRPEAEALKVLEALSKPFKDLELDAVDVSDNALGQKGLDSLLSLFTNPLLSLRVCNNGMSAAATAHLVSLVDASRLETFHFFNNMSGDDGALAVAQLVASAPCLTDLRFSGTRAQRAGSLAVTRALHSKLIKLDLVDNSLATDGARALADFLMTKPPLRHLDVRDCALEDDGFAVLAPALDNLETLRVLDVSGNDLTELVGEATLQRLASLALEDNDLGSKGVCKLATLLAKARPPNLTALVVSTNDVKSKAALVLARAIRASCPAFERLDINGNNLSEDALTELPTLLGDRVTLGPTDDNDPDDDDEEDDFEDLIEATASLIVS